MIFFLTAAFAQEPPPVGEGIVLRPPIPEVHTLSDGTPVWLIEEHSVPLVRVEVSLRQGYLASSDPVAALLVGGLLGADEQSIGVGGARVWADIEVLSGEEDAALAALRAALLTPQLRAHQVRRRARQLSRDRTGYVGVPGRIHNTALSEVLFPDGHPLSLRPVARDYRRVSPDRARAAWSELLDAGRPAILVVGDTTADTILPMLESHLLWLGGPGVPATLPPLDWSERSVVLVDAPGSDRSWVSLVFPAPGLDEPHLLATEVATRVLGGDFTSRLSTVLREERGFVYDITADLTVWPGMGRIEITCSVDNDDLIASLEALEAVVDGMRNTPPDAAEIDAARRAMVLQRAREMGSLAGLAAGYGTDQVYGLPPEQHRQRYLDIDALSDVSIAEAVDRFSTPALWLITGDGLVIEPMLEASAWAPDRVRSGWSVLP
ncbi:MAG: insulinase family protein [Myxococcota bacterium]|nr:insulinase family protein [Myxococcota bacterium]